jgi:hypothetical protein
MSQIPKWLCTFHCKRLLSVGIVLVVANVAHAASQVVPCSGSTGGTSGLIHAIETANNTLGPNMINLAPGCIYTLNAQYPRQTFNGLPAISGILTINGYGATIGGAANLMRIFAVFQGGTLILNRVIIRGGRTDASDAPAGSVAACEEGRTDGDFADFGWGGGICVDRGAKLILNHSTVTENVAGSIVFAQGGGIYSQGSVTLNCSVVSKNIATTSSEGGALGGGIRNDGGTLTLVGSSVHHNSIQVSSMDTGFARGGGIYSIGKLVTRDSVVSYNTARASGASGANVGGGGIASFGITSLVRTVVRNNIVVSDGGDSPVTAEGGGLLLGNAGKQDGNVTIVGSFIFNNVASAAATIATPTAIGGG